MFSFKIFKIVLIGNENNFDMQISLNTQKKSNFKSKYSLKNLNEIAFLKKGTSISKAKVKEGIIPVIASGKEFAYYHNESNRKGDVITIGASGEAGYLWYHNYPIWASDSITIEGNKGILTKYLFLFLKTFNQKYIFGLARGQNQKHVYEKDLENIKIPLPPLDIQQKDC